jgi:hypothetical protein
MLFGSLNTEIADYLSSSMDAAVQKGVQTLPMVAAVEHGTEQLVSMLRSKYYVSADLFELYCSRNVFSLQMYPEKRRAAIAELYQTNWDDESEEEEEPSVSEKVTNDGSCSNDKENSVLDFPSADQIPSAADLQALEQETVHLRDTLQRLKQRRDAVSTTVKELNVATQLVDLASEAPLLLTSTNTTRTGVQAAVNAVDALKELQGASHELRARMDEHKRQRDATSAVVSDEITAPPVPQKAKTAATAGSRDERYEHDRKQVAARSVKVYHSLIAPSNNK